MCNTRCILDCLINIKALANDRASFATRIQNKNPRFGVAISMMGGMVKHDCKDPADKGEFCWSENTQAVVLGSYFYGYTAQFLAILLAKRLMGLLGYKYQKRFWRTLFLERD